MLNNWNKNRKAFTLIELLIVIGILAVLATTVLLVINPAQLVKQSRDANRITEINQINQALLFFQSFGGSSTAMGNSNTIYISLPDTDSQCGSYYGQLTATTTGWNYHCSTSANYRNIDGTGWIPVDLSSIQGQAGTLFSNLPIDPIQASDLSAAATNGYYYTYIHGSWALSATMESDKYLAANAVSDGGQSSTRFELGNDLTLNANLGGGIAGATCGNNLKETGETCDGTDLNSQTCATQLGVGYTGTLSCNADCLSFNTSACTYQIPTSGLVGYWKFDDGSGTSASDSSGNGYTGTLYNGASWTSGKVNGALNFDSSLISAVDQPLPSLAASSISISLWVYRTTLPMDGWWDALASRWYWSGITARQYQLVLASPEVMSPYTSEVNWMVSTDCSNTPNIWSVTTISLNTWTHILVTYDKTTGVANIYINGQLDKTGSFGTAGLCSNLGSYPQQVGAKRDSIGGALNQPYGGKIDEVAVYNRALTADEALAIYNGQK